MKAETNFNRKPVIGLCSRLREEDNSFTLPAEYSEAIVAAGGIPVQIPLIPEAAQEIAAVTDAIVLCGSPSDVEPALYGQCRRPEVTQVHHSLDQTSYRLLEHAFEEK